jgi:serine protease Do
MAQDPEIQTHIAEELASVAEDLRRSTVQVRGRQTGVGSGVIWRTDGLIITNAHVVRGAKAIAELADGQILEATVTARDQRLDLAALQVNATNLPAVTVGDSNNLRVGELVLAVGNPLGLVGVLTTGIIHAIQPISSSTRNWVQADVRLSPGNSGGPLANAQGHVIGINSMIVDGRAFAVPSHTVERFLQGDQARPYLGVTLRPVLLPLENRRRRFYRSGNFVCGLLILEVAVGSLAETAQLMPGDVLMGVNGSLFKTSDDLANILSDTKLGDVLQLDLLRGGDRLVREVIISSTARVKAA